MPKYALDTNVYIDGLRQPAELLKLKDFLRTALPHTYLNAVVHHELLAGARSPRQTELLEADFILPFARRNRLVVPSAAAWREAGRLRGTHRLSASPALVNDLLLAVSSREYGITVVSRDSDFRQIARLVPGLRVVQPYPTTSAAIGTGA